MIDASFGERYARLKAMGRKFTADYGNASINYSQAYVNGFNLINETSQSIRAEVDEKAGAMHGFVRFVDGILILIYLKVVYGTADFDINFLSNLNQIPRRCNQLPRRLPRPNRVQQFLHHEVFEENRPSSGGCWSLQRVSRAES